MSLPPGESRYDPGNEKQKSDDDADDNTSDDERFDVEWEGNNFFRDSKKSDAKHKWGEYLDRSALQNQSSLEVYLLKV